ncbi:unnamed protein product [Candidula unifasciata]|uniref:Uncharacterized protein n=1 Tax=Candidula unifasciata TaxID=100452 RepID=A0A8S3ZYM8_9EUPU|nr:unnamed protein product [Candidula unifasciata]
MHNVPSCDSNNSTERPNITTDSNTAAVDVLTVQLKVLQQQVSSLQELQDTKNHEQEIMLDSRCTPADTDFHLRLQNVEAKLLLLQDVQTRDYTTLHNAVGELSTPRIDIMSLQDDISSIKKYQKALKGKTEGLKKQD